MAETMQLQPMSGAGAAYSSVKKAAKSVRTAIRGYEEYVDKTGKKVRVYGGLNGMSPSEYDDWWHKRGKYASKKASAPPLRRSLRLAEKEDKKRRASMGGSRKTRKNSKSRKSRK